MTDDDKKCNQVVFMPFRLQPITSPTLYSISKGGESQVYNRKVDNGGWLLNFTRPTWGRGSYTKLIPAGAIVVSASWMMVLCEHPQRSNCYHSYHPVCRNVLNPKEPYAPITIFYNTPEYILTFTSPFVYRLINFDITHEVWGKGRAMGIIADDDDSNLERGRIVLTFPAKL